MITKKILHWVKFKQLEVNRVPFLKFCSLGALEVLGLLKNPGELKKNPTCTNTSVWAMWNVSVVKQQTAAGIWN